MTRKLAVAALAAAALAVQAAFLHLAVASPLASALGELEASARPASVETRATAQAPRPSAAATRS